MPSVTGGHDKKVITTHAKGENSVRQRRRLTSCGQFPVHPSKLMQPAPLGRFRFVPLHRTKSPGLILRRQLAVLDDIRAAHRWSG
jgi:hypothetical protein